MKNLLLIFILGLVFTSCKPKQVTQDKHSSTEQNNTPLAEIVLLPITISEMVDMKNIGDAYIIENATISGDQLILQLSYSGGCENHKFELLNNNAFKERSENSDFNGYETRFTLKHNANNDHCRSIVREKLHFDLLKMKQVGGNQIKIQLSGWENDLIYTYTI